MKNIRDVIDKILKYIIIILAGSSVIVGTIQIIGRFVINYSIPWSEEFIRYSFVWITFLGASLAVKENAHVNVIAFLNIMPRTARRLLKIISNILCIVFSIAIILHSISIIVMQFQTKQITSALQIPIAFIFFVFPISAVVMIIYFIENIVKVIYNQTED